MIPLFCYETLNKTLILSELRFVITYYIIKIFLLLLSTSWKSYRTLLCHRSSSQALYTNTSKCEKFIVSKNCTEALLVYRTLQIVNVNMHIFQAWFFIDLSFSYMHSSTVYILWNKFSMHYFYLKTIKLYFYIKKALIDDFYLYIFRTTYKHEDCAVYTSIPRILCFNTVDIASFLIHIPRSRQRFFFSKHLFFSQSFSHFFPFSVDFSFAAKT